MGLDAAGGRLEAALRQPLSHLVGVVGGRACWEQDIADGVAERWREHGLTKLRHRHAPEQGSIVLHNAHEPSGDETQRRAHSKAPELTVNHFIAARDLPVAVDAGFWY